MTSEHNERPQQRLSREMQNLVQSAVAGDLDSFGDLATRYYAALVSIAYAICGDRHLAEDAAQEARARALVRLRTLERLDRFGPWLCRICRNVAHDMLARRARQASSEDISSVRQPAGGDDEQAATDISVRRRRHRCG